MDATSWGPWVGTVIDLGVPALLLGGRPLERQRARARSPGTPILDGGVPVLVLTDPVFREASR